MFPPDKSLKSVTRGVRNLPEDPAAPPPAAPTPSLNGPSMKCPSCGASFTMQPVADAPPEPAPTPAVGSPEGPGF